MAVEVSPAVREPPVMSALHPADMRLLPVRAKSPAAVASTEPPVMVRLLWTLPSVLLFFKELKR